MGLSGRLKENMTPLYPQYEVEMSSETDLMWKNITQCKSIVEHLD